MLIKAPAKINLSLRIISKRADGYHEISSEMQAIRLFDDVGVRVSGENKEPGLVSLKVKQGDSPPLPLRDIPEGPENLVWRAAELAFNAWRPDAKKNLHADIVLKKNIPAAAGLAGGSSDAAAVLLGLAKELQPKARVEEIAALGARIGADIPFCVYSCAQANPELGYEGAGLALAEGIGELISPLPKQQQSRCAKVLLVKPDIDVSSKEIYELYDKSPHKQPGPFGSPGNDLEEHSAGLYPVINDVKTKLMEICNESGACKSNPRISLTGSGPTVFVYVPADRAGSFSHPTELNGSEFDEAIYDLYVRAKKAFPSMFVYLTDPL